jgi:hypothetical protein
VSKPSVQAVAAGPGCAQGTERAAAKALRFVKNVLHDLLQFRDPARHLLLACRELLDAARYLFLTGRDLVDAARYLLVIGVNIGGNPVDATRHLVLSRGDPVNILLHRVKTERHCVELLLIERRGGWRGRHDHVRSVPRKRFGLRR